MVNQPSIAGARFRVALIEESDTPSD
jgi:hypothetical protein